MGKILVVDDELDACNVLSEFLTEKGYEVHTATDGLTAISKVSEIKPNLVLLDMVMPGIDGLEVLKKIRKIDPTIGVIMVTVVAEIEKAKKTFELGAYDYVTKPVDLCYLEKVVEVKMLDSLG